MSIATLARKSRAQRGASTRTGWTLATTKSGNCPDPCGGGAPAKQQSFRRLMKNKARPGVEQEAPCCTRTQRVEGSWTDIGLLPPLLGDVYAQNQGSLTAPVWVLGTLLKAGDTYGIFEMSDCDSEFNTVALISSPADYDEQNASILDVASVSPPIDTYAPCDCCPPVATWKKTNDPKGEQSIGYYLWRKKQLTHNCIKHCIPHREHYNATCTRTQRVEGDWIDGVPVAGTVYEQRQPHGYISGTLLSFDTTSDPQYGVFQMRDCNSSFLTEAAGATVISNRHSLLGVGAIKTRDTIVPGAPFETSCHGPCDNVGCKCNCNKSMGGTACCVVHKTMLPLSNSENIAWVVEDRTCLQTSKPDPRNPNTC